MIEIGKPYRKTIGNREAVCAKVTIEGKTEEAWFAVEPEYGEDLTDDRADAFVVGFLTTAMRLGADIRCEAPVTARLWYQLTHYVIPTMSSNMDLYHSIAICAQVTDAVLPCKGAVGTGFTGGVDCMYTLYKHQSAPDGFHVTHLLCANNGALESDHNSELLDYMAEKFRGGIAKELGLSVISVDTNLQLLQEEPYLAVASFRLPAVVLALQKLFRVFLNSAAYEFSRFAFVPENCGYYEFLLLSNFETDTTVFYSAGAQTSRIRKIEELVGYEPARKYLHPCIYVSRDNCGKCGKCVRTLGALYALDALDAFHDVFDVEEFLHNKDDYMAQILAKKESQHYGEVLYELKRRGKELSPEAQRKARIIRAAAAAAAKNLKQREE